MPITSTTRKHDPLKDIIFRAMEYVEHKLNSRIGKVTYILGSAIKDFYLAIELSTVQIHVFIYNFSINA